MCKLGWLRIDWVVAIWSASLKKSPSACQESLPDTRDHEALNQILMREFKNLERLHANLRLVNARQWKRDTCWLIQFAHSFRLWRGARRRNDLWQHSSTYPKCTSWWSSCRKRNRRRSDTDWTAKSLRWKPLQHLREVANFNFGWLIDSSQNLPATKPIKLQPANAGILP